MENLLTFVITFLAFYVVHSKKMIDLIIGFMLFLFFLGVFIFWLGHEYLGYIYLILYFGAILMLFLFTIMLLDITEEITLYDFDLAWVQVYLMFIFLKSFIYVNFFFKNFYVNQTKFSIIPNENFYFIDNLTFEFFLLFFNTYSKILLLIGLLLLLVMVGLLKILIHSYEKQILLHEIKKKNQKL